EKGQRIWKKTGNSSQNNLSQDNLKNNSSQDNLKNNSSQDNSSQDNSSQDNSSQDNSSQDNSSQNNLSQDNEILLLDTSTQVHFLQLPADNKSVYSFLTKPFTFFYTFRPDVIERMEKRNLSRFNQKEILFPTFLKELKIESKMNKNLTRDINPVINKSYLEVTLFKNEKLLNILFREHPFLLYKHNLNILTATYSPDVNYFSVFKNIHLAILMAIIQLKESEKDVKFSLIVTIFKDMPELSRINDKYLKNCFDDLKHLINERNWMFFVEREVERRNVQWIKRIKYCKIK
ncbi:hypothetical protein M153_26500011241, partial [Pseudoloma neurophilia]